MRACYISTIFAVVVLLAAGISKADQTDIFTRKINRGKDQLIFPNSKGEVVFTHSKHLTSLNSAECILCHKIENPTIEKIQSRFENHRVAHNFCKGCHQNLGKGPIECHQCHNYKKTA